VLDADGKLAFVIAQTDRDLRLTVRSRQAVPSGWHQIACTYDGSGNAAGMKLYVDGRPVAAAIEQSHQDYRAMQPGSAQLLVGALIASSGPNPTDFFNGEIADLRLYRGVVDPKALLKLWRETMPR
jgi:hypothetical protein